MTDDGGVLDFILPDLGEGLEDAEIVAWHVEVGDVIVLKEHAQALRPQMLDESRARLEPPRLKRCRRWWLECEDVACTDDP